MADFRLISTAAAAPAAGPYANRMTFWLPRTVTSHPDLHRAYLHQGQLPAEASGAIDIEASAGVQMERCINNVAAILQSAGSGIERVVKTTVFLMDMADFAAVNAVYGENFSHRPARSCIAVRELPKGARVEIECVALSGESTL